MIKHLAIAATFAAASLVTASPADARNLACMQKHSQDIAACEGNANCEMWADIALQRCLEALADSIE